MPMNLTTVRPIMRRTHSRVWRLPLQRRRRRRVFPCLGFSTVDRGRRAYHFRSVAGLGVAESVVAGCRKFSCRLGPKKSQNFFGLSRQNSSVDVAFIASVMRWKCFRGVVPSSEPVVARSPVRAQRVGERRPVTEKASTVPLLERSE